jgi:phage terminase large subunit-like protein
MLLAGRGFGKTRCGAEWIRSEVKAGRRRLALVAPTAADVRDIVVEGESGILAVHPEDERPIYEPSKRRLTWPNGAVATTYSADEPERLRGQNSQAAWCDELGSWRYPDAFDQLLFGMRSGDNPRVVVTTTPRPTKLIRDLVRDPTCIVTRGSSYENRGNLAPAFFDQIVRKYEGTRLGRQELEAELLEDTPGALWTHALIEANRVRAAPDLLRVVVAIDPAVTSGEESDETGIIVAGKDKNGHGYVLADLSGRYAPTDWAKIAIAAYRNHKADRIVAEVNNGGEMVEATLRMVHSGVAFSAVHASRGKVVRAEPIAAIYEQGRGHHVGTFPQLEEQMTNFTTDFDRTAAGYSPDRVDALVWAFTNLLVEEMKGYGIFEVTRRRAAGETIEQIAGTVAPPATKDDPAPTAPRESLFEVYRREVERLRAQKS